MTEKEILELIARQVGCLTIDVGSLKDDMRIIKEDVRVLKEDVRVLKEDVRVLKEDVRVLKEDVSILKSDVNELKEGQAKLEKQTKQIFDIFDTGIKPKIALLFTGYAENSGRLDRVEAKLDLKHAQ